jgi:hypothetical protein
MIRSIDMRFHSDFITVSPKTKKDLLKSFLQAFSHLIEESEAAGDSRAPITSISICQELVNKLLLQCLYQTQFSPPYHKLKYRINNLHYCAALHRFNRLSLRLSSSNFRFLFSVLAACCYSALRCAAPVVVTP